MHSRPMHGSGGENPLQSQQAGGSSQADAQGIAVVFPWHSCPARKPLFAKRQLCVIPRNTEQKHQETKIEWADKYLLEGKYPEPRFERYRCVVRVHSIRNFVVQEKGQVKRNKAPGRPEGKPFPRNRAGCLRAQIYQEDDKRSEA